MKGASAEPDEAVAGRLLILSLLTHLATQGYAVASSLSFSPNNEPRHCIFFRPCAPVPKARFRCLCVSLYDSDKVRLLGWRGDEVKLVFKEVMHVSLECASPFSANSGGV